MTRRQGEAERWDASSQSFVLGMWERSSRASATIAPGLLMDEDIQQWLHFAESDMKSAEVLHRVGGS